ncbi:MAG: small, acid-soluble spore protein, alpha/beta type [Bacillota bacterium]
MATGQSRNQLLVPQARAAMERFKYETAAEVGVNIQPGAYLGDVPSRINGSIGGQMVKKMIASYEQTLAGTTR